MAGEDVFGGEIAAADGAFHRGGPAGFRPIASELEVWEGGLLGKSPLFAAGSDGKDGAAFGDTAGVQEFCFAGGGPDEFQLPPERFDRFLGGKIVEFSTSADDDLIVVTRFGFAGDGTKQGTVEDPLSEAVDEDGVGFVHEGTVEPKMDACDGRSFESIEILNARIGGEGWREEILDAVVGDSKDEIVGFDALAGAELRRGDAIVFDFQGANSGALTNFDALPSQIVLQGLAVEFIKGDGGHADLPAFAVGEEAINEDLAGVGGVDTIEGLTQGADEHDVPETIESVFGLVVLREPSVEAEVVEGGFVSAGQLREASGEGPAVLAGEETEAIERAHQVEWSGQGRGRHFIGALIQSDEIQAGFGAQERIEAGTGAELFEIRAAAHGDVLAVVDDLTGDMILEGCGAATETGARF